VEPRGQSAVFLSIVTPCFNEEQGIATFIRRVIAVGEQLAKSFEIVLVNDGSTDATWQRLLEAADSDARIVAVNLSRNFGQEAALTAGLSAASGDCVLMLDADLQDPPELLPEMLSLMESGADVVYGQRRSRSGESWFKRTTAAWFYRIMDSVSDIRIPRNTGHFRLVRRRVVDVFQTLPEANRYSRGLFSWVGFNQVPIVYDRAARLTGESHWPTGRMLSLAMDAFCAFSRTPLRLAAWGSVCSMLLVGGVVFAWLLNDQPGDSGRSSLLTLAVITGAGGMQLACIAVLGEYLGRISDESRGRPLYVVESVIRQRSVSAEPGSEEPSCRKEAGRELRQVAP
jgi:dolichol-phosphate mannosyltransferase